MKLFLIITFFLAKTLLLAQTIDERRDSLTLLIENTLDNAKKLDLMIEKLSYSYYLQSELSEVEKEKNNVLQFAKQSGDSIKIYETNLVYSYILLSKYKYPEAESYLNNILVKINKNAQPVLYTKTKGLLLKLFIAQGKKNDSIKNSLIEIENFSNHLGNSYCKAIVNEVYAYYLLHNTAEYIKAINYYLKIKTYLTSANNNPLDIFLEENRININLAISAMNIGNYEFAIKYYQISLEQDKKYNNYLGVGFDLYNLSVLHYDLRNYNKSLEYNIKTHNIAEKYNIKTLKSLTLANFGSLYYKLSDYDKSINHLDKLVHSNNDPYLLSHAYSTLFSIYLEKKDVEKSLYNLKKEDSIASLSINYDLIVNSQIDKAMYYEFTADEHKALEKLKIANKLNKKSNRSSKEKEILKLFQKLYTKTKQYKKAHQKLQEYNILVDSLNTDKHLATLKSNQLLQEHNKKVDSLKFIAKQQQILKEQKIKKQKSLAKTLSFGGIFLLLILGVVYYFYHQRKKLTLSLQNQQQELSHLNKLNNKLLTVISHDVKSPLVSLKHMTNMLVNKDLSKEDASLFLEQTNNEIKELEDSLENVIHWGETQLNNYKLSIQPFNIAQLTLQSLNSLAKEFQRKSIHLNNQLTEHIFVLVDKNHYFLVLRNILTNAIKYTPENGSIHVHATKSNKFLKISVTDTGVGIKPEQLNKLLGNSKVSSEKGTLGELGTGVGLSISKEMIEKNNGKISIESTFGKGTTVSIHLPLA